MNKQLRIRRNALPILKNKEAALRIEVKKARLEAEETERLLSKKMDDHAGMARLWEEFDFDLVKVDKVHVQEKKIAGVRIPDLESIDFKQVPFSLFNRPVWFAGGIDLLKEWTTIAFRKVFFLQKMELLDYARKKTTQKVNLYEKVQIPDYEDAIRKIRRFLEDEENLAKSAQKIVKNRQQTKSGSL